MTRRFLALALLCGAVPALAAAAGPPVPSCNGTADDTAALNALLAPGSDVTLPKGVCRVTGSVNVPAGARLAGAGIGVTIIRADPGMTVQTVRLTGPHADLSGLTVDGGATGFTQSAAAIEVMPAAAYAAVHDLEVENAGSVGVRVQGSYSQVRNVHAHDNQKPGIYVVGDLPHGTVTHGVVVAGNTVENNGRAGNGHGGVADGIDIDRETQGIAVLGNTVTYNDIIVYGGEDATAAQPAMHTQDITVIGNTLSQLGSNALDTAGYVDRVTFYGNHVAGTAPRYGFHIHGPATAVTIAMNDLAGSVLPAVMINPEPGIAQPPSGVLVEGNTFGPVSDGVPSIVASGGATGVTVKDNNLAGGSVNVGQAAGPVVAGNS